MTKISVILPVYNMAEFLERSINSVLQQSLKEIELICVDDASTDTSVEVIRNYMQRDARLKLLVNPVRLSALQSRKNGIMVADGEYIMFLDADDYLESDACEILYNRINKEKVDILHFPSAIEDEGVTESRLKNMESFVKPYMGMLKNQEVFTGCFLDMKYRFSIWNKIYRTDICKRAMEDVTDGFLLKANDLILYTAISLYACSYKGIEGQALYHYSFGSGSTGSSDLTIEQFEVYCYEAKAARMFQQIVEEHDTEEQYAEIIARMKKHLLRDCIYNWKSNLSDEKAKSGFELLVRYWGAEDTVTALAEAYAMNRAKLVSRIIGAECLICKQKQIKTLGIYYHRMGRGGVQRVISLLLPLFLEMGYEVVLFTDEYEPETEYEIPMQVNRVLLTSALTISYQDYGVRARELVTAIEEYSVDLMLYQAAECRTLVYDMLLLKTKGIYFCVCVHELFSAEFLNLNSLIIEKLKSFQLVDRLIVLSEMEKTFWEIFGIPATYIPNPIQDIAGNRKAEEYILWLARLEGSQKQHMDAVEIMNKVVMKYPDAKMKIVGHEVTKDAKKNMLRKISAYGLEENIELHDYTTDVSLFYENAKIFLCTSSWEAFPMTLVEGKAYGIPLVLYEMPYLEILKDGKGYLSVPQSSWDGAATAILRLLKDEALRVKLGREARESYIALKDYDLKSAWMELFHSMQNTDKDEVSRVLDRQNIEMVMQTLLFHYCKGGERMKRSRLSNTGGGSGKESTKLCYIEPDETCGKMKRACVKCYNLYVHYRKHGAKEAWRVIRNKIH